MPVLAYGFSLLFYILLVMAALTSSISMLEMSASIFIRKFKLSRPLACLLITLLCLVLGTFCSLSFGPWSNVKVFGMGIFDLFDFLVAKFFMPVGALLVCLFAGWVVDKHVLRNELTNSGALHQPMFGAYYIVVRFIAPVMIVLIFLNELGFF